MMDTLTNDHHGSQVCSSDSLEVGAFIVGEIISANNGRYWIPLRPDLSPLNCRGVGMRGSAHVGLARDL